MDDYTAILRSAYEHYLLPLGGKKVPAPYRVNWPFQSDRSKYGKSDPQTLLKDTLAEAEKQHFNLNQASVDQIKSFMEKNQLGIDCSGFAYHLLDMLLKQTGEGGMTKIGYPEASRTNVKLLTADNFTRPVSGFISALPGDLIHFHSGKSLPHVAIIIDKQGDIITYAHSSGLTDPRGVHQDQIIDGILPKDLEHHIFDPEQGDGIRRLKVLQ